MDPKLRKAEAELAKKRILYKGLQRRYQRLLPLAGQGSCADADLFDAQREMLLAEQDVIIAECDLEIVKAEAHGTNPTH